jgi:hypothetical protein
LGREHPVQQDAVCDCAAEAAKLRPHGCHHNSCLLREELPQLCNRLLNDLDRRPQLTGPNSDPESCRIETQPVDLSYDLSRLVAVERKDPDAQVKLLRGRCEVGKRLQSRGARLIIRPQ